MIFCGICRKDMQGVGCPHAPYAKIKRKDEPKKPQRSVR